MVRYKVDTVPEHGEGYLTDRLNEIASDGSTVLSVMWLPQRMDAKGINVPSSYTVVSAKEDPFTQGP